jgi:hypothetical protein
MRWTVLLLGVCLLSAGGCAGPQSTRLTAEDFDEIATRMAASLRRCPAIAARTPTSPLWVITIDKVTNLSNDVMSEGEKWYIMARVRGMLPMLALRQDKNIRLVIPAERRDAMLADPNIGVQAGELTDAFAAERQPTHTLEATFRSITRADATHRTDAYVCDFQLLDLRSGEPPWVDQFEFKRAATGHVWD